MALDDLVIIFGHFFLEASAGTGKTFAIEHIVVRALLESSQPLTIDKILIVTFTRAATRELKHRVKKNLIKTQLALQQGELAETVGREGAIHGAWLLFVREGKDQKRYRLAAQNVLDAATLEAFRGRIAEAATEMSAAVFQGPRVNSFGGSSVSSHRWQRVQAVCGD